jgi:hypothetical protein
MSFTLNKLTEGIRDRHVGQQNKRLVEKWSRTGLLRGMGDVNRENMATLLENQAAQVLRESNTMSGGEVGGFTNIAFPIVRRVFGGLIANELVSIQPMSLPSGLLFYLDYTYGTASGAYGENAESIYGGPSGKAIQAGADGAGGQYDLVGSGYSRKASAQVAMADGKVEVRELFDHTDSALLQLVGFDSQLIQKSVEGQTFQLLRLELDGIDAAADASMHRDISVLEADRNNNAAFKALDSDMQADQAFNVRRLNRLQKEDANNAGVFIDATPEDATHVLVVVRLASSTALTAGQNLQGAAPNVLTTAKFKATCLLEDSVAHPANTFGEVEGTLRFEGDGEGGKAVGSGTLDIPEIDIKIESIPVTAQTRKLRARWSPELAQDLNAYHSMDAEVELTQILSEQIALEIDREILGDLLTGAKGANFFWSRSPGKFVNKRTGAAIARTSTLQPGPAFTGTVREWYETLTETVIDVANEIHRKTLRGSANFIVVSPDVATILEASVLYRPSYSLDGDGQVGAPFTMGAEKVGTLSNRFTVYKDPYFPRNKILVGYKGGSYLETGFVYAPYVPLIVTPTIFQPDDFTPRKGVMTRYGKKMVRADFYGTVTCLDMNII